MKTCFSEGKLMKQFGNPLFLRGSPLSTNPPISEQFFHDPPLCPNFKNKNLLCQNVVIFITDFDHLRIVSTLGFCYDIRLESSFQVHCFLKQLVIFNEYKHSRALIKSNTIIKMEERKKKNTKFVQYERQNMSESQTVRLY